MMNFQYDGHPSSFILIFQNVQILIFHAVFSANFLHHGKFCHDWLNSDGIIAIYSTGALVPPISTMDVCRGRCGITQ